MPQTGCEWGYGFSATSLWPVRTYTYCSLHQSILEPSLFLELRIEQKRNEKGLALTVSEREKQSFLRISMCTAGLSLAAHLFPLLVRLTEWTQLIKEWGYCLQGRRLPSLEIFWLDLLTGERKARLVLPEKKGPGWHLMGLFLSSDQTGILTSCLLNYCPGVEEWVGPWWTRRNKSKWVGFNMEELAEASRVLGPPQGPDTLSQCGLDFSLLVNKRKDCAILFSKSFQL